MKREDFTIKQFLNSIHRYTERVDIVIVNDLYGAGNKYRRVPETLSEDVFKGNDYGEKEEKRLLKYYGDVPVWNVCARIVNVCDCHNFRHNGMPYVPAIIGHVHFSDIKDGWEKEKTDNARRKRAEYRMRRKERKD